MAVTLLCSMHMSVMYERRCTWNVPWCRAALAAKEAELAHAEAELAESQAQVKTLSAKYDRVKQHLEHDEQALAAQHAEYEEAQAAAKEAAASSQAAVARESARQKNFLEQVQLSAKGHVTRTNCLAPGVNVLSLCCSHW